jgi:hypothetical protein
MTTMNDPESRRAALRERITDLRVAAERKLRDAFLAIAEADGRELTPEAARAAAHAIAYGDRDTLINAAANLNAILLESDFSEQQP